MISFGPIVARLKEADFAYVAGVLEFAGLENAPRQTPALFVVPERDSAAPNTLGANAVDQKVAETFSVVVVEAATRITGTASEALVVACGRVTEAMLGWRHPDAAGGCEYGGGRLVSVDGHQVVWALSFRCSRHIRKVS